MEDNKTIYEKPKIEYIPCNGIDIIPTSLDYTNPAELEDIKDP